jgi:molecular chaperone DnaJ
MRKDYYKILGLSDEEKNLHGEEFEKLIKGKFRKISLECHPDRLQGKSDAEKKAGEERFKEASEAYEVLSDEKKRAEYDNPASNFQFNGMGGFSGMDIDEVLRNLGGFGPMGGMGFDFMGGRQEVVQRGSNIRISFNLTLEELFNGVTKKIKYKRYVICDNCHGTGLTAQSKKKTCRTCGGSGTVIGGTAMFTRISTCPTCGGKGHFIENPCPKCGGHGLVQGENEIEVQIPKGVCEGMTLINHGMGNMPPHGEGVSGDLHIVVHELKHKIFERDGNDLEINVEVPMVDAIMGCEVDIPTIDGRMLKAKVKPCTYDGYKLKFKGFGMPIYGTSQRGDMIANVLYKMPKSLNEKEKRLLGELKQQEHFR